MQVLWEWLESRSLRRGPPEVAEYVPGELTGLNNRKSTAGLKWYKIFIGFILCSFLFAGVMVNPRRRRARLLNPAPAVPVGFWLPESF